MSMPSEAIDAAPRRTAANAASLAAAYPPRSAAAYALALLMITAIVSLLDRQILTLLVQPIKADLGVSDTQVSLLQGFAFALFYTFMGIPLGLLVDRVNRRNLIVFGVLVWSAMTIACGLSRGFWTLFLARVGVGIGEAVLHPAAYSLMSDYFAPASRGRAFSLFSAAGTLGIALSWVFGGAVLSWLGNVGSMVLPALGQLPTWKIVFLTAGVPGLVLIPLLLTLREPTRRERAGLSGTRGLTAMRAFLKQNRRAVGLVLIVNALIALAGYGVIAWMAASFVRVYGVKLGTAGLLCGLIMGAAALIGAPIGGYFADRFTAQGRIGGKMLIPVFSGVLGAAAFSAWWLVNDLYVAVVLGIVAFSIQVATTSTAGAALTDLVPNELRGQLSAVFLLVTGVAGIGLGPTSIALVTDHLFHSEVSVRYSMIVVAAPCLLLAALLSWVGRRVYSNTVAARRAELFA
jgi:MFS family permease